MPKMNYRTAANRSARVAGRIDDRAARYAKAPNEQTRRFASSQAGNVLRAMPGSVSQLAAATGLAQWKVRKSLELLSNRGLAARENGVWQRIQFPAAQPPAEQTELSLVAALRLRNRFENGTTVSALAGEHGVSVDVVRGWLEHAGAKL